MGNLIETKNIRNVCLLGHGGNGKTSLAEAMLYIAKETDRLGKTDDGNTVCDFDAEETKRKFSLSTAIAPLTWKGVKINLIDTPGYQDFSGEVAQGLRVAGTALIVMDAKSGVDVGSELAWDYATKARVPKAFFINKMDDENANFGKAIEAMRIKFGNSVCPIEVPIIIDRQLKGYVDLVTMKGFEYLGDGKTSEIPVPEESVDKIAHFRERLVESVASTSDEMLEKFFEGEEFSLEEMQDALNKGIISGAIAPVFVGSAAKATGIASFLDIVASSFPNPLDRMGERDAEGTQVKPSEVGEASIFVFKTVADPFVGKMSYFKVMNGSLKKDSTLTNRRTGKPEKFSHIYVIRGKKQTEVDELACGDIGMTAKLSDTNTNDTLGGTFDYEAIVYPKPYMKKAILPKDKGDEDKISQGIARLLEEDRTMLYENDPETKQLTISGLGDIHLDVIVSKLKSRYGANVELKDAKIAYRETIKKQVQVEGPHTKRSVRSR